MRVENRQGRWCVVDDNGDVIATAPTEEHAKQRLAMREAAKPAKPAKPTKSDDN